MTMLRNISAALAITIIAASSSASADPLPPKASPPTVGVVTSPPAATTTPSAYFRKLTAVKNLSNTADAWVGVLRISVPAGKWMVSASAGMLPDTAGNANYVRCGVFTAAGLINDQATTIGTEKGGVFYLAGNVAFQAPVVTTGPGPIDLKCSLEYAPPGGAPGPVTVANATLSVIPVAGIK